MRMDEDGYGSSGCAAPDAGDDEPLSSLEEEVEAGEDEASDSPRTQMIKANIRVVRHGGRHNSQGWRTGPTEAHARAAASGGGGGGYAAAARAHWSH